MDTGYSSTANHIPQHIEDTIRAVPDAVLTDVFIRDLAEVVALGADIEELTDQLRDITGINKAKIKKLINKRLKDIGKIQAKISLTQAKTSSSQATPDPAPAPALPTPSDELQPRRQHKLNNAWRDQLLRKADDTLLKTSLTNAALILNNHPSTKKTIRYNQFTQTIEVVQSEGNAAPWRDAATMRNIADIDYVDASISLETMGMFLSPRVLSGVIETVAAKNAYDPLKDYLNSLEWDQKPRLTGWLSRVLGVESNPYTEAVGSKFLVGAVARGLSPGCKMDTMLILEGPQGIMKSTVIKTLFSPAWFTDEIHAIGSKDASMQLQGRWGIEISEMHAMNRAETNAIKEWITRTVDRYRPPYAKCLVEAHRRCVLVGTLNPEGGYLKDPTGGRRFWPVICHKIDVQAAQDERDQLFAEAKHDYDSGGQWWLTEDEEVPARLEQADRQETDGWDEIIDDYCYLKSSVTTLDIMKDALGLLPRDMTRAAEKRIGSRLRFIGRKRVQRRINGIRRWFFEMRV